MPIIHIYYIMSYILGDYSSHHWFKQLKNTEPKLVGLCKQTPKSETLKSLDANFKKIIVSDDALPEHPMKKAHQREKGRQSKISGHEHATKKLYMTYKNTKTVILTAR